MALPVLALGPVGIGPLDAHVAADVLEGDALHAELSLQDVEDLGGESVLTEVGGVAGHEEPQPFVLPRVGSLEQPHSEP